MTQLLIKTAEGTFDPLVLDHDTSFEYNVENPDMSDYSGYTMEISLPMEGCPQNVKHFGFQNRLFGEKPVVNYPARLVLDTIIIDGYLIITEQDRSSIKVQFIESFPDSGFDPDGLYIDALRLATYPRFSSLPDVPANSRGVSGTSSHHGVTLPIRTKTSADTSVPYSENKRFCPYLIFIAREIATAVGLKHDFTEWQNSPFVDLIICNGYGGYGSNTADDDYEEMLWTTCLPHWSVRRFFNELGNLLGGKFEISTANSSVTFTFSGEVQRQERVKISADKVLSSYSIKQSDSEQLTYIGSTPRNYADVDFDVYKFYKWNEVQKLKDKFYLSNNPISLSDPKLTYSYYQYIYDTDTREIYYSAQADAYFVARTWGDPIELYGGGRAWFGAITQVGQFAASDAKNAIEVGIVPAPIGWCLFPSGWTNYNRKPTVMLPNYIWNVRDLESVFGNYDTGDAVVQQFVTGGVPDDGDDMLFDKIYVAFWNTANLAYSTWLDPAAYLSDSDYDDFMLYRNPLDFACPVISPLQITCGGIHNYGTRYDLSLNAKHDGVPKPLPIDTRYVYNIKFVSREVPDVRKVFEIQGTQFLCSKMRLSFDVNGRSELIEGEFYRVLPD